MTSVITMTLILMLMLMPMMHLMGQSWRSSKWMRRCLGRTRVSKFGRSHTFWWQWWLLNVGDHVNSDDDDNHNFDDNLAVHDDVQSWPEQAETHRDRPKAQQRAVLVSSLSHMTKASIKYQDMNIKIRPKCHQSIINYYVSTKTWTDIIQPGSKKRYRRTCP